MFPDIFPYILVSTMFTSDYLEKEEAEVQLNGFDSDTFDAVLNYTYTGYVEVSALPQTVMLHFLCSQ